MCGIVGKIHRDPKRPVERELIERMKSTIVHRGPDEDGTHLMGPAGMGFRRLAIIDLATGQQPMANEDHTVFITFNGEIYNFQELRDELLQSGHQFRTNSDTETILHGYEEWGPYVCSRLRGMFAFAIFDSRRNSLFLARDRVGKKPLYYSHLRPGAPEEALIYGSELKTLLPDPLTPRRLSKTALNHYLSLQFVPDPLTIYQGVFKLSPGHWLSFENGHIHTESYWDLRYEPKLDLTEDEAIEGWRHHLDDATRIRLMSEVPLGCFLSGGLDSTAIVQAMRRHVTGDLRTFSIGFEEDDHNELPFARQVARKFNTIHEEFIVRPDALAALGALAWHYDEPMADSSAIPSYYLAQMTRRHVTVALNGDGGDESYAGYRRYDGYASWNKINSLPEPIRKVALAFTRPLSAMLPVHSRMRYLAYLLDNSFQTVERQYAQTLLMFPDYHKRALLDPDLYEVLDGPEGDSPGLIEAVMMSGAAKADIDKKMFGDIKTYLPGALLTKIDRATMAHSIEGRSPFLDQKLMEFAASLPPRMKYQPGHLKTLTKRVLGKSFPEEFINRPKMGFGVPIGKWLRGPLQPLMRELLLGEPLRRRGLFNQAYIKSMIERHVSGREDSQYRLWTLMTFEAWARTFLDRADPLAAGPIDFTQIALRP